ncbi:MAG: hypothetical protein BGO12_00860 [Verrucomicrobia bacterium 61-8]|nr:mechanosensitive ion channel [Verrucomicrobiota bacterium]OJV07501.1 MAG: hypothetical protein BGO12_00860 [Verrucomicrobia bacterium 61-8]
MKRSLLLVFSLLYGAILAVAQPAPTEPSPTPSAAEKKDWLADQLEAARQRENALNEKTLTEALQKNGLPTEQAADFLAAANEAVRNYQTASDTLTLIQNNERALQALQTEPPPKAPANDQESDAMREKINTLRQQIQTEDTQVQLDQSILSRSQTRLDSAEQDLRRIQQEADAITDPAQKQRSALQVQLAQLRRDAAASAVSLADWRVTLDQIDRSIVSLNLSRTEKALAAAGQDTIFNRQRAESALTRIEQTQNATRSRIEAMRKIAAGLNDSIANLSKQREEAKKAGREKEAISLATQEAVVTEAASVANKIIQTEEGLLTEWAKIQAIWKLTLAAIAKPESTSYEAIKTQSTQALSDIEPWREQLRRSLQDTQRRLEEAQAEAPARDAELRKQQEARLDALRKRATQLSELVPTVDSVIALQQQMISESRERLASQSIAEKAALSAENLGNLIRNAWNKELFITTDKITDSTGNVTTRQHAVSLGKLLSALVWLVLAFALSKVVSRTVCNRIQTRFSLDPVRVSALEKALFVAILAIALLTILNWLNIPLTAFAFMGGALAIGIGFGAQTLVNNFISGLILLAERRIKVGDTIEVDGHTGSVLNLGTRCSRVRKGNGSEVLVPNSYLLEKNVVNWTLTDYRHAFDFAVGLSYGTDISKAIALLHSAVDAEGKVLKSPAPVVFFEDFGSQALIFRVSYWVDLRGTDNRVVGSNIRTRIAQLCQEQDIQISAPNQDLRLHTPDAIRVRMISQDSE